MRIALFLSWITLATSAKSAVKQLEDFWIDPIDILGNIDEYRAIWIKPHGCVWSECAIDDTDDGVVGDNRDGDGQWYQYRTQEFCANAAFSLYGAKKGELSIFGCTRKHYINSFFTYGGADNLLKAAGIEPIVYYDDGAYNNTNYTYYSNADCQDIDEDGNDQSGDQQDQGQSGDNNNGYVSSMGCDAEGNYIIATFNATTCDGNYFSEVIAPFTNYNKQHESLGCTRIYAANDKDDYEVAYLLNNSWSCDLDLYPNGCPDPYGNKERWDFAIRTVGNGGNAQLAYRNMLYKRNLRISSAVLAAIAVVILAFGYRIKNRDRIESKGGKHVGYARCLWEDFLEILDGMKQALCTCIHSLRPRRKKKRSRKKKAVIVTSDLETPAEKSSGSEQPKNSEKPAENTARLV